MVVGSRRSRPSRARGLKPEHQQTGRQRPQVAPLAGAWIETTPPHPMRAAHPVAPLAGAWIETCQRFVARRNSDCRAPRGRVD